MGLNLDLFMDNKIIIKKKSLMYKNLKLTWFLNSHFLKNFSAMHEFVMGEKKPEVNNQKIAHLFM